MKSQLLCRGSAAAVLAASLWTVPTSAQTTSAGAAEVQAETEGLGDIVVTAQRRTENLQRAAVAISVVGNDALRAANVATPAQLTNLVPALQAASSSGGYSSFYIRGVGNFASAFSESAVAFNYDGVFLGRSSSTTGFFYDVERIEVLKGPQGTLYGRNATGGAINVLPHKADFDWNGYASVRYGNYNSVQVDGAVNAPLGANAGIRISGIYARHDGYMKDGTDDQNDIGGRVQLRWEPSSQLSVRIGADYFRQRSKGAGGTPIKLGVDNRFGNFSPEAQALYQTIPHALGGRNFDPLPDVQRLRNDAYGINATIEHQSDIGTFTFIPAYRRSELDAPSANVGFYVFQRDVAKQLSFEGRYASPDSNPLRLILGSFYYRERGQVPQAYINNVFFLADQRLRYGTSSYAFFGRLTYDLAPNLRLNGGIRYTNEDKTLAGRIDTFRRVCTVGFMRCPAAESYPNVLGAPPVTVLPNGNFVPQFFPSGIGQFGNRLNLDRSASFDGVTWRAGIDWDVSPRNLVYASYETGFKSGGIVISGGNEIYRPEKVEAWTIGSKNRFFNNRLQINLEAFHWRYTDQQISHVGIDAVNNSLRFITENVGKSTIKGAEIELDYLLTPTTRLNAAVQYVDSIYNDFTYFTPVAAGTPQSGCAVTAVGAQFAVNCSGRRPPQSPEWRINFGIQQTLELANDGRIVVDARVQHQSRTLTSLEYLTEQFQAPFWTADAQATYHAPGDRFEVGVYMNNIGNKTVIGQSYLVTYAVVPTNSGLLRPPRTYGIRSTFKF